MAQLDAFEQYILELVNNARANPEAEADRLGIDLNQGLAAGTLSNTPKQPLAHNSDLQDAADFHSGQMLSQDFFAHVNPNTGSTPASRAGAFGYGSTFVGENIALRGTTATITSSLLATMTQSSHDGLFKSAGHRENILNDTYRELGLGSQTGQFTDEDGFTWNALLHSQSYGRNFASDNPFLTGVTYTDTDNSKLYSIGEAAAGVSVNVSGAGSTTTQNAGGYGQSISSNTTYTVTFSGAFVSGGSISAQFTSTTDNVKIDLVDGKELVTSTGLTLGAGAQDVRHIGLYGGTTHGNDNANTMTGGGGRDKFYDKGGADTVNAGDGDDYVRVGGGQDNYDGGAGKDYISYYDSTGGVTLDLEADTASGSWANNDTVKNFESASGSKTGADTIKGTSGSNAINTYGGNDKVYDRGGADTVKLGDGDDYVRVGGGEDNYDGGAGKDYISYYDSTGGVTLDLEADTASGSWANNDTVKNFESASGSKTGADTIKGTSGSNAINTYGGNDKVYDRGGADTVKLGDGDDYVRVGGGEDNYDGGAGKDYISYYDSTGGVTLDLEADTASGSWANNDTVKNFESASGSKTGADNIKGTSGSNTIRTYGGDDKLYGRSGNDMLHGGDGEDYFDGGHGDDILYGGDDADTFHFDKTEDNDTIKDFENNIDTIELDNFGFADAAEALTFATEADGDVIFDFGGGDTLTVENATKAQLLNDIDIV